MKHLHSVYDSDTHFIIDPITKVIKKDLVKKVTLVQGDHNSERFTFEMPRFIEGHDMLLCDLIEVHFDNINTATGDVSSDYYEVADIQWSANDENVVVFSWLISDSATKYAGTLEFSIKFKCTTDGVCDYQFNTAINNDIFVVQGKDNSGVVVERAPIVVDQWRDQIFGSAENAVANINLAEQESLENVQKAGEDIANAVEIAKADVFNVTANAIKETASGEIIRVDDVSHFEHQMNVKVHGKNFFDISKIRTTTSPVNAVISEVGEDYIIITTNDDYTGNGFSTTTQPLKEVCPNLEIGKTYTLSATTESNSTNIYFSGIGKSWVFGKTMVVTEELLNSPLTFYGLSTMHGYGTGDCRISNIQIEEGETATEYEPYIAPETVKVTRCGKNFWHSKNLSYPRTVSGVTIDYDPDTQIYTFNGTSTSPGDLYVLPNNTHIMTINAGETWTLKIEALGGNIDGVATSSGKISPLVNTSDYKNTIHANVEALYSTKTYTEPADITKMYFYVYASGIVFNNFKCRIQFELNNKPTEFEKSTGLTIYTPNVDGTVENITSISPTTTILTDTEGVKIECEYTVDTKLYIDRKFEELKALLQK